MNDRDDPAAAAAGGLGRDRGRVAAGGIAPAPDAAKSGAWPGGDYPTRARLRSSGARRVPAFPIIHPAPRPHASTFRRCYKHLPRPGPRRNLRGEVQVRVAAAGIDVVEGVVHAVHVEAFDRAGAEPEAGTALVVRALLRRARPRYLQPDVPVNQSGFPSAQQPWCRSLIQLRASRQNRPRLPARDFRSVARILRGAGPRVHVGASGHGHRGCRDGGASTDWALRNCWKSVCSLQTLVRTRCRERSQMQWNCRPRRILVEPRACNSARFFHVMKLFFETVLRPAVFLALV